MFKYFAIVKFKRNLFWKLHISKRFKHLLNGAFQARLFNEIHILIIYFFLLLGLHLVSIYKYIKNLNILFIYCWKSQIANTWYLYHLHILMQFCWFYTFNKRKFVFIVNINQFYSIFFIISIFVSLINELCNNFVSLNSIE